MTLLPHSVNTMKWMLIEKGKISKILQIASEVLKMLWRNCQLGKWEERTLIDAFRLEYTRDEKWDFRLNMFFLKAFRKNILKNYICFISNGANKKWNLLRLIQTSIQFSILNPILSYLVLYILWKYVYHFIMAQKVLLWKEMKALGE